MTTATAEEEKSIGARERAILIPMAGGEVTLTIRALRYLIHGEYRAISEARKQFEKSKRKKDELHAEDVKQHAILRVKAANDFLEYLQDMAKKGGAQI